MKTLVFIALFATANLGTTLFANPAENPKVVHIDDLQSKASFHQHNINALWNQYDLSVQRIRNSNGSHADLERDETFFVAVYQQDIDNNIRVEESKKIIAEIRTRYAKAHAQRSAQEARRIATLQTQLKKALEREAKALSKTKQAYADQTDTPAVFQEVENYVNESIARVDLLLADAPDTTIAVR